MTPTRWRVLVLTGLIAAVLGYAVVRVWDSRSAYVPPTPLATAGALALVALAVLVTALSVRGRVMRRPGRTPLPPLGAARLVVLAKTSSHAGALLAGGYLGLAAVYLPDLSVSDHRQRVVTAGLTALAAIVLVLAGLLLERLLRLPPDQHEQHGDDSDDVDGDHPHQLPRR